MRIFIELGFCLILERLFPGWKLPDVPIWTIKVLAVTFVQSGIVTVAGLTLEKWFSGYSFYLILVAPILMGIIDFRHRKTK